ncbi:MAG: transglutaminase domain-containing protein, partial [Dysgonamonadaceae bacterium]|nr:transglutaminase domain-containing protein [Dysgonamonadaceae bacterium]
MTTHKSFFILILILFVSLFDCLAQSGISKEQIAAEEIAGNFAKARHLIDMYIAENDLSPTEIYELNARKDIMRRIRLDFKKDKASVIEYVKKYYPDVNDEMLAMWEKSKALEYKVIDGEKWYFNRAASNLFRLDKKAADRKAKIDKPSANKESVLKTHLSEVVNALSESVKTQAPPVKMKVKYEVTLQADAVPDGETVRCWLPYPRSDNRRQTNIILTHVDADNYVIAPAQYSHRTIYVE